MATRLPPLVGGHALQLLEGGDALFAAMVAAIDQAAAEVRLETYIFDFTGTTVEVAYALERAARRGVAVLVAVDGVGSDPLPPMWAERFDEAGVRWLVYAPLGRLGLALPGSWRRLHRKLCVVDGVLGFCGGINLLDDRHDPNHGALAAPRFDFAVRVMGPLVADMHWAMRLLWQRMEAMQSPTPARLRGALFIRHGPPQPARTPSPPVPGAGRARAALLLRDNLRNRRAIELAYRRAIARAQREIVIANAYFLPGRKLRQLLVDAAGRGVRVVLLLQGRYEYFMQYYATRPIYGTLLTGGVEIHEYAPSFLHAKVAVIDGRWATVGSSNLDPLSLLLAREANVAMDDKAFAAQLRERLMFAVEHHGQRVDARQFARRSPGQRLREGLALALMRLALLVTGKRY